MYKRHIRPSMLRGAGLHHVLYVPVAIGVIAGAMCAGSGVGVAAPLSVRSLTNSASLSIDGDIGPGVEAPDFSGLKRPQAVAVDTAGNVYVTDRDLHAVFRYGPRGSGKPIYVLSGLADPTGVAVDAHGDLYVTDGGGMSSGSVLKIAHDGKRTPIVDAAGWHNPTGVAVDAQGAVYVTDDGGDGHGGRVVRFTAGTAQPVGAGWYTPRSVAVDPAGNVYVADDGDSHYQHPSRVVRVNLDGTMALVASDWRYPKGVAVDAAGTVFVSDHPTSTVFAVSPSGEKAVVQKMAGEPVGLALGPGVLYVVDSGVTAIDRKDH